MQTNLYRSESRNRGSKPWPRWVILGGLLVAGVSTVFAVGRASTNYGMTIDATTVAGGPAISASYQETDAAVGQEAYGFSSSPGFQEAAGVVQNWGNAPTPLPTRTPLPQSLGVSARQWVDLP